MKLRLVLKTLTNKGKEVIIKFNVAPSKHLGLVNFINLALNQNNPITLTFEKISKNGQQEQSKIQGTFKFEGKDENELKEIENEAQETDKIKKKQKQKKKSK